MFFPIRSESKRECERSVDKRPIDHAARRQSDAVDPHSGLYRRFSEEGSVAASANAPLPLQSSRDDLLRPPSPKPWFVPEASDHPSEDADDAVGAGDLARSKSALCRAERVLWALCSRRASQQKSPDGSRIEDALWGPTPVIHGLRPGGGPSTLFEARWRFWRRLSEWPQVLESLQFERRCLHGRERHDFVDMLGQRLVWPEVSEWRALYLDRQTSTEMPSAEDHASPGVDEDLAAYSQKVGFSDTPPSFDYLARVLQGSDELFADRPAYLRKAFHWVGRWQHVALVRDTMAADVLVKLKMQWREKYNFLDSHTITSSCVDEFFS